MEDHFGVPLKGDVFYQRAIIADTKPGHRTSYLIHVSNEHGIIEGEKIGGEHTNQIFVDNFEEQFTPDPDNPTIFRTTVTFDSFTENGRVKFYRHDKHGRKLPLECVETKEKFFKTHFLLSHDISVNINLPNN